MPGIMEYHQSAICTKTMALVCGKDRCSNTSPHFTVGIAFTHGLQQEGCRWLFLCWTPAGFTQLTHHQMCRFCVLPCASDSVSERHICCWIMRGRPAIWHPPRWCEQPGPLGGCSSASTLSFPWVCIFYPPTKEKKSSRVLSWVFLTFRAKNQLLLYRQCTQAKILLKECGFPFPLTSFPWAPEGWGPLGTNTHCCKMEMIIWEMIIWELSFDKLQIYFSNLGRGILQWEVWPYPTSGFCCVSISVDLYVEEIPLFY